MIKRFQYHKFRELFLIEQNVEVKIDLEILDVSLNVYDLWVSSLEEQSSEVGGSRETPAYFVCSSKLLSTCGGVADLSAICAIEIVVAQLR